MGWDAFGLPAENAAFERGVHPAKWTQENIASMRDQLRSMGLSYDWSREIATCDPDYYQHEQKMFIDFYKAGLAYKKESWVNWDPVENTVLANEQVIDGMGWRSGAPVEKRLLSQWFLKITEYAEDLLQALEGLDRWPERVRLMQHNWIGKSEGARVFFNLKDTDDRLEVFTTRPDTLYGASFCAISANHPIAARVAENNPALAGFIAECNRMGTSETGIETAEKKGSDTGLKTVHPLDEKRELPVYVANFVLMEYGTGAIFGCPAHDQRDLDFARKYDLPVTPVVLPPDSDADIFAIKAEAYTGPGTIFNSGFLNGLSVEDAKSRLLITCKMKEKAKEPQPIGYAPGAYPVNAIGAVRFHSSIARIAALFPFRRPTCPSNCRKTWILKLPAIRWTDIRHGNMSPAQSVVAKPSGRPTLLIPSLNPPGISPVSLMPRQKMPFPRKRPNTGFQLINISAVSSTRSCICFIPVSLPVH